MIALSHLSNFDYQLLGQVYIQLTNEKLIDIEYDKFIEIIFKKVGVK